MSEPVVLVDHKGPAPIKLSKIPILISQAVLETQPAFGFFGFLLSAQGKGLGSLILVSPQQFLMILVGFEDDRSHGPNRVHESIPILNGHHAAPDFIKHPRIIHVVVHRLVVPIDAEVALGVGHPPVHLTVKDAQVIQHGLPGPNCSPRTQHGFVIHDIFAFADGPFDQPVLCGNREMLLKDLEAVNFWGLRAKGIPLKEGIPHVRDENWPPAGHGRIGLAATEFKEIA
mmetsp:Transcript_44074/g.134180  ORF Transcript_44074/g.134180 Transcript_44074/m.134180 type:complete len:229 (+) Transcript_44074:132-818(+)